LYHSLPHRAAADAVVPVLHLYYYYEESLKQLRVVVHLHNLTRRYLSTRYDHTHERRPYIVVVVSTLEKQQQQHHQQHHQHDTPTKKSINRRSKEDKEEKHHHGRSSVTFQIHRAQYRHSELWGTDDFIVLDRLRVPIQREIVQTHARGSHASLRRLEHPL